jgi:heptosyltransferase-3
LAQIIPFPNKIRKILFISHNRLGDCVLSTSLIRWANEQFPDAKIHLACGKVSADLFTHFPSIVDIYPITKEKWNLHWLKLWSYFRKQKWDLIIDLKNTAISRILPSQQRLVLKKPKDPTEKIHKIIHYAKLVGYDKTHKAYDPILFSSKKDKSKITHLLGNGAAPHIVLSPAANWRGKQWRAENFAKLINDLKADPSFKDAKFILLGAPNEMEVINEVIDNISSTKNIFNLAGELTLTEITACLEYADLFIGNDSGLMHMAAAVKCPTIGLFGPSHPEIYGPWGENTDIVKTKLAYHEIVGVKGYDHKTTDTLMDSIDYNEVLKSAKTLYKKTHKGKIAPKKGKK